MDTVIESQHASALRPRACSVGVGIQPRFKVLPVEASVKRSSISTCYTSRSTCQAHCHITHQRLAQHHTQPQVNMTATSLAACGRPAKIIALTLVDLLPAASEAAAPPHHTTLHQAHLQLLRHAIQPHPVAWYRLARQCQQLIHIRIHFLNVLAHVGGRGVLDTGQVGTE